MKKRINRQKDIQNRIEEYCGQVTICIDEFKKTFVDCCARFDRETVRSGYKKVHDAEGKADDIRRELENVMYSRAIFPESRGDILGLVETMDRVPNCAESVVRMILNQHIPLPSELCQSIVELVSACAECVAALIEGVGHLFHNYVDASITVGKIDKLESVTDQLEEALIDRIFTSDIPDFEKILLRDLVIRIGSVADRAENVGDRIRLMVAKRSI